jgi:hypothetical protein
VAYETDRLTSWCHVAGSVLEFHLYDWRWGSMADADIWPFIRPTVCEHILPEMCDRGFELVAGYVQTNHVSRASSAVSMPSTSDSTYVRHLPLKGPSSRSQTHTHTQDFPSFRKGLHRSRPSADAAYALGVRSLHQRPRHVCRAFLA